MFFFPFSPPVVLMLVFPSASLKHEWIFIQFNASSEASSSKVDINFVIVDLGSVTYIDVTGAKTLTEVCFFLD